MYQLTRSTKEEVHLCRCALVYDSVINKLSVREERIKRERESAGRSYCETNRIIYHDIDARGYVIKYCEEKYPY